MATSPAPEGAGWLTLQEASRRLDVHPSTLRQWADRGRIRTFRTPGGHRRFSADDVETLLGALPAELPSELDLLLSAALGRARRDVGAGRLGEPWHRLLDPATRDRFRQIGRALVALLVRSLAPGADAELLLAETRRLAREQGSLAARSGLTAAEVVRAHAALRAAVVECVLQLRAVKDHGRAGRDPVGPYRTVAALLDEALCASVETCTVEPR